MDTNQQKQFDTMTKTPIPKLITVMAIPAVISMLVTSLYNIADTMFIGMLKDNDVTSAISVVLSLMAIIQAFGFAIGMGSGSIISRLLGKKDQAGADAVASSATLMAIVSGLFISVLGLLFVEPLMRLLGGKGNILPYAKIYGTYILLAAPIMTCSFTFNNFLRAEGKANLAMVGLCTGALLNIALDPILIFGADMGIEGAAVSTVFSQFVGFIILLSITLSKHSLVKISPRFLKKGFAIYGEIIKTGMPSFIRQGLSSIATALINSVAFDYGGSDAVSALGVVQKVFMVVFCLALGIGQGYQPVLGYNYGAKRFDRVRKGFYFTLISGTVLLTVMAIFCAIFARNIAALFLQGETAISIAVRTLLYQCCCMPLLTLNFIMGLTYQSIGKKVLAVVLSCTRQGLFYIPSILFLPMLFNLSGIECAQAVSDLFAFLFALPFAILFIREIKSAEANTVAEACPAFIAEPILSDEA